MQTTTIVILFLIILPLAVVIGYAIICGRKEKDHPDIKPTPSSVKSRDYSGSSEKSPPAKPVAKAPVTSAVTEKHAEKPSKPTQVFIYVYSSRSDRQYCPFCDGENNTDAIACMICGQELRLKGEGGHVL